MTWSVAVPVERTAPAWLLAQLRRVDPTVDLVYVGEGKWWLGAVTTPTRFRYRTGMRLLRRALRSARPLAAIARQGLLVCQGFTLITEYQGDPSGAWVDDFARRDFEWRYHSDRDQYLVDERAELGRLAGIRARAEQLLGLAGRALHRMSRGRIVVPVTRGITP